MLKFFSLLMMTAHKKVAHYSIKPAVFLDPLYPNH